MITAITGKVGSGKNLYSMVVIQEYLLKGRRVVANFGVKPAELMPPMHKLFKKPVPEMEFIQGRPDYETLRSLGRGGPREHRAGLLVLDEVGPLLNARTWQDKDRQKFIDWLLHSRKLAWDVILIVQNIGLVDKQIRTAVIESMVTCKRMDRLKMLGIPLPRVHMAVERYGTEPNAPISGRRVYQGNRYFKAYDTTAMVSEDLEGMEGVPDWVEPEAPKPEPKKIIVPKQHCPVFREGMKEFGAEVERLFARRQPI